MNIKQTEKELTILDNSFILPVFDGMGRPVIAMDLDKEYRIVKRSCYYVLMEDSEIELAIPALNLTIKDVFSK